jgi:hypothetical protein
MASLQPTQTSPNLSNIKPHLSKFANSQPPKKPQKRPLHQKPTIKTPKLKNVTELGNCTKKQLWDGNLKPSWELEDNDQR